MKTVEIVIRIPKKEYYYMISNPTRYNVCDDEKLLYNYIKNGTILQKGHNLAIGEIFNDEDNEVENEVSVINKEKASTAYWVKEKGGGENYYYYACSKCACIAPNTEMADGIIWKLSNYCPDCGRKMEKENGT